MNGQSMIKLLIFDFDGTIVRSKSLYFNAIYSSLKKYGYEISRKSLRNVLGLRLEVLLRKLGIKSEKEIRMLKNDINNKVLKKSAGLIACPDVKSLRNILQKSKCVLVTNSLSEYTYPFLKKHNLKFAAVMGAEKFSSKEEAFRILFRKFKIKPEEAIYIADRAQDVDIAGSAGCKVAIISNRCSWSSLNEIKTKKPDYIINSLAALNKSL